MGCRCVAVDLSDSIGLLLLIGSNIFGVYALYKILQMSYWFLKDRSKEEDL
ncbi:MAG: hypothetical protein JSV27_05550 [Candidatus Bathyarchaeota archaeon]|nr:MAG: hypothetical protein JSV27_05550 [Candidatus Bathyarchaeota archaeon]